MSLRITDDRGVQHLIDFDARVLRGSDPARVRAAAAWKACGGGHIESRRTGMVWGFAIVGVQAGAAITAQAFGINRWIVFGGLFVGVMFVVGVGGMVMVWGRGEAPAPDSIPAARLARALLVEGFWPVCAYDLVGIPVAGDACIECPECGAAWRAERIARTDPLPPPSLDPMSLRARLRAWGASWRDFDYTNTFDFYWTRDDRGREVKLTVPSRAVMRRAEAARPELAQRMRRVGVRPLRSDPGRCAGLKAAMLAQAICPCCAGDLAGIIAPAQDGLVECPHCTAAWAPRGDRAG